MQVEELRGAKIGEKLLGHPALLLIAHRTGRLQGIPAMDQRAVVGGGLQGTVEIRPCPGEVPPGEAETTPIVQDLRRLAAQLLRGTVEQALRLSSVELSDGKGADPVSAEQMADGQEPGRTRIGVQGVCALGLPKGFAMAAGP